ncbi:YlaH-like family protein [Paenibacillus sacheonensis]|uniref:YlaH-like protein n=1 Tax=Paenibacillus sacheonensis TaxID=742054 RepID=A0A7X4YTG2_9BACL|nr:ribose/xylose/arabinose/galactoside ABC-type transport system permease subunit [Paenibacillus sacheonensis]NBC72262.1 hypothetical protein [Paenibacillus sacheonensis]
MQHWLSQHPLLTYILILAFIIYIFNAVFRASKRLPILKEILVHLIMVIGAFVLFILQDFGLPILQCMAVAVFMMLLLRGRQLYDKIKAKRSSRSDAEGV